MPTTTTLSVTDALAAYRQSHSLDNEGMDAFWAATTDLVAALRARGARAVADGGSCYAIHHNAILGIDHIQASPMPLTPAQLDRRVL